MIANEESMCVYAAMAAEQRTTMARKRNENTDNLLLHICLFMALAQPNRSDLRPSATKPCRELFVSLFNRLLVAPQPMQCTYLERAYAPCAWQQNEYESQNKCENNEIVFQCRSVLFYIRPSPSATYFIIHHTPSDCSQQPLCTIIRK